MLEENIREVEIRSFPSSGTVFNGRYKLMETTPQGASRGVYKGVKGPVEDYCIWWHKPYRHWWIGNCRKVPNNHGYAWLKPREAVCPTDGAQGQWRRGGTDAVLPVGQVINIDSSPPAGTSSCVHQQPAFLRLEHDDTVTELASW